MKKILFIILALLFTKINAIFSQISYGGSPYAYSNMLPAIKSNSKITLPKVDVEKLISEDRITDQYKDIPLRFGFKHEVDLGIYNSGEWTVLENGDRIWRLAIECPAAKSINFAFDQFYLPIGSKLFIYNGEHTNQLGAFTEKNNNFSGKLGVGLLRSDNMIIEYYEPFDKINQAILHINYITHGYRTILKDRDDIEKGPFGNSGACENNVVCPIGDPWGNQINSVALIVVGGNSLCTGALVANTALDNTPYFLTANHCVDGEDVTDWVYYFNHQSSTCTGNTGPTNQSVSGSSLKAKRADSDFALLLLTEAPPEDYNVYFSGWDRTDALTVTSTVCIHHPSGDVKKISLDEDAPNHQDENWYIENWEDGVTEGGSSGSPLYDQNKRIIGQLFGGLSACNGSEGNGEYDVYGRFGLSWDGVSSSTRLKDWLDPSNTGLLTLGGDVFSNDAQFNNLNFDNTVFCGNPPTSWFFSLINNGTSNLTSVDINYSVNGNSDIINWTGNLPQGFSESIEIPLTGLIDGSNTIIISSSNPNGVLDDNTSNDSRTNTIIVYSSSTVLNLSILLDQYPDETSWILTDEDLNIIYSGGSYSIDNEQLNIPLCVGTGCYDFSILDSYGDGIISGSILLTDESGNTLVENNSFEGFSYSANFCATVGIVENKINNELIIYPNPSSGRIIISSKNFIFENNIVINIYNSLGQVVLSSSVQDISKEIVIDCSSLSNGIYSLNCIGEKFKSNNRLLIKK